MVSSLRGCLGVLVLLGVATTTTAGDWPMWRYDAQRSACTPEALPKDLAEHWRLELPPLQPAWPDQPLMPFDAGYEPIVVGQRLFVGSSRTDGVTCYDTRTGRTQWHFNTDGPVRFAPLVVEQKLYFVSDDGYLYCLQPDTGALLWKFRGGPTARTLIGNTRLISMWPARGAPIVADGVVYFAAGIWPFMGVFVHALDAATGKPLWVNDGDGSLFIKQPHAADAFAGIAPQGPLSIQGNLLLIPGGRSVPAAYDRKTGKLVHYLLNENSKKGGGHTVIMAGEIFLNGPGVFRTTTGKYLGDLATTAIGNAEALFAYQGGELRSFDPSTLDLKAAKWKFDPTGATKMPAPSALMKAGSRLYVGRKDKVEVYDLPLPVAKDEVANPSWSVDLKGTPISMVAGDDRLFVVTKEGTITCFAAGPVPLEAAPTEEARPLEARDSFVQKLLETTKISGGYAVVWSAKPSQIATLSVLGKMHVVAFDPDPMKVQESRTTFHNARIYGDRCAVHMGDPLRVKLPPYMASLMIAGELQGDALRAAYEVLRPYGGTMFLPITKEGLPRFREAIASLPRAQLKEIPGGVLLIRAGALPGAADWTHEHADAANTRVSKDTIVKAPLGVLWFGGTSNEGILPRHGHGPQPQVIEGRIIIEGVDKLRATDVYTGRLLWETAMPGLGEYYDNLAHQPGANARGTNYISTADGIYVAYKNTCWRIDPATGRKMKEFTLPKFEESEENQNPTWGYLNVIGDYLIGGADPLFDAALSKQSKSASKLLKFLDNDNYSSSRYLTVLDRHTGKVLWTAKAKLGFRHNAICAGGNSLFAIDRLSGAQLARMRANSEEPTDNAAVIAFDLHTGKERWRDATETFGTWLSYSEKYDVLVEAGRVARDTLTDEPKGMRAYRGKDGKELWFQRDATGPAMLRGDMILRGQGACDLLTGQPKMRRDPITGVLEEWLWSRTYGCNTPAASEHLLTFRSGAAGFYDLCHEGGTGNFGGFRSSCTNNLIVANGVLCAPDYTRTCTCSYQNQTSIALVPMDDVEEWTFYGKSELKKVVQRVGFNLGAPGDRRADDGTLWLEYPVVGGSSPAVAVHLTGAKKEYFRRHQSAAKGERPWVVASGVKNVEAIAIKLLPTEMEDRFYTVRLYFAEPDDLKPGERVFDVTLQGRNVLDDFDIVKEAGEPRTGIVREFRSIRVDDELRLSFKASKGGAVLCGIEIVAE